MTLTEIGAIATTVGTVIALATVIWNAINATNGRLVWRSLPVILCVVFGVAAVSLWGLWIYRNVTEETKQPEVQRIEITYPLEDASVPQEIIVEGYATLELAEGQYLYVVVEQAGLWWPQYGRVKPVSSPKTKRWEWNAPTNIGQEEDVGKTFNIVVAVVDRAIRQYFEDWLRQGEKTGWPGLPLAEVAHYGELQTHDRVPLTRR